MRPEGLFIQTMSSRSVALIRAVDNVGLDFHMMRTVNDGALRAFMEIFSWAALPANDHGLIVFPAFAMVPYLDYEYSVFSSQSGGMLLLTGREERIYDPRLSLGQVVVGTGCNYQRITWNFSQPFVADDWPNTSAVRFQLLVLEVAAGITVTFNSSFAINETVMIPNGSYRPSTLYWLVMYVDVAGPARQEGAVITKTVFTCAQSTNIPPALQQVALANISAFALNVSWDCSHLGSFPSALVVDYKQKLGRDGAAATTEQEATVSQNGSSNSSDQDKATWLVPVAAEDIDAGAFMCSVRVVLPNAVGSLTVKSALNQMPATISAALQFSSGPVTGLFSAPVPVYNFVPTVDAPTFTAATVTNCLTLNWAKPECAVALFEIQVSTTLMSQIVLFPGDASFVCINPTSDAMTSSSSSIRYDSATAPTATIAANTTNADTYASTTATTTIYASGSKLRARYRAVSPAGASSWSGWVDAPTDDRNLATGSSLSSSEIPAPVLVGVLLAAVIALMSTVRYFTKRHQKLEATFVDRALNELKQFTSVVKPHILEGKCVKVLEPIGEGKFGQVCKATWRSKGMRTDASVAVKSLHDGFPEEATRAFATEACVMVSVVFV